MKKNHFTPTLLVIAALLGACASMPASTGLLEQTRSEYANLQNTPNVGTYAPLELKQAGDALNDANTAATNHDGTDKIDKLAYLAKQKIALTQEVVKQKTAEASVLTAGKERDQMRLDARTKEADQAKLTAEQAKMETRSAQILTDEANARTAQANLAASDAQQQSAEAQARQAQLEAQLADISAKTTQRGIVITLGDVLFGTDLARLNAEGMRTAQKLADILQQNPQRSVLVEGFTDSTGTAPHNQELSERRAGAVRSALQELGVSNDRIATHGYGEGYPVAGNDNAQNRQLNRRVEIVLSDANGKITQR